MGIGSRFQSKTQRNDLLQFDKVDYDVSKCLNGRYCNVDEMNHTVCDKSKVAASFRSQARVKDA